MSVTLMRLTPDEYRVLKYVAVAASYGATKAGILLSLSPGDQAYLARACAKLAATRVAPRAEG